MDSAVESQVSQMKAMECLDEEYEQVSFGDVPLGDVSFGDVPLGDVSFGDEEEFA